MRINQKIEKSFKKFEEKGEFIDMDKLLDYLVEEYFEAKKRICRNMAKNF